MESVGPVFVAGCPRSGTSALSWAIAALPGYWTSAETHFFYYLLRPGSPSVARAYDLSAAEGSWLAKHGVTFGEFLRHLGDGFDRLMRSRSGGLQWIDGSPENVLVGEQLLAMYPGARMFLLVRDPRATCRSMLTSGFDTDWARDGDAAIRTWLHYAEAGMALASAHPERVLRVRQEDMRDDAAGVATAIGERLRLGDAGPIATFLATQRVNSSFDRASLAETRFRAADVSALPEDAFEQRYGAKIRAATAGLASQFGYAFG